MISQGDVELSVISKNFFFVFFNFFILFTILGTASNFLTMLERFAEKLTAFADAGVQRVFIWPVTDEAKQLELFWEKVRPLVPA